MDYEKYQEFLKNNDEIIKSYQQYAFNLHDNVVNQKYGDNDSLPYSYHLQSVFDNTVVYLWLVVNKVENENDILPVLFAAYFHDSIEDARLTYNDVKKIAKQLGMTEKQQNMAADIVYALTNEKGHNRTERANEAYYKGIRETPYAPLVKMADRLANMSYSVISKSHMIEMYQEELPHFINNIIGKCWECSVPSNMINFARTLKK